MEAPFDVFLSHNSRDKPAVDQEELIPGRDWQKALEAVLATVPCAAVFFGSSGLGPWEEREMRASLQQLVDRGAFVIPVLLPGAPAKPELPLFLQAFTWVDLRGGITGEGMDRLVWGITEKKPLPSRDPAPGLSPPPLHNLPFESLGDLFKGRAAELAELEAATWTPGSARAKRSLPGTTNG